MSKKETRRAARQAFPRASDVTKKRTGLSAKGSRTVPLNAHGRKGQAPGRPVLRPPTLKRAAIQGAILAVLYLLVIRLLEPETSWVSTIVFAVAGFVLYTGVAYAIDNLTYRRRLKKLKGQSK